MKKSKLIASLIALSLGVCPAFAAGSLTAKNSELNVTVSGVAEDSEGEAVRNGQVLLTVYKTGKTADDINGEYEALPEGEILETLETVVYINSGKTDGEGKYSFLFELPETAEGGKYKVFSRVNGTEYETTLNYVRDADKITGIGKINSALSGSLSDLIAVLDDENYSFFLSLFTGYTSTPEMYEAVKEKESFHTLMASKGKYSAETLNESIELINKNLDESILLSYAEGIDDLAELENYVNTYADKMGLDISGITEENKETVYGDLAALTEFTSVSKVKNSVIESVVLFDVSNAFSWGSIKLVMEAYSEVIGIDISSKTIDYDKLYHKLFEKKSSLTDIETIKNTFDALKPSCKKQPVTTKPSGGGGGGGGGSVRPSAKPEESGVTSVHQVEIEETVNHQAIAPKLPFSDVPESFWAYVEIKRLFEEGIVKGKTESTFEPQQTVTREEFVAMLVRAAGLEKGEEVKEFSDVYEGAWFEEAVKIAVSKGIIGGREDGTFGAGEDVSRQDIAVMISNMEKGGLLTLSESEETVFTDEEKISEYAKEAVKRVCGGGILKGYTEGDFKPLGKATRAEAAAIITRILDSLVK